MTGPNATFLRMSSAIRPRLRLALAVAPLLISASAPVSDERPLDLARYRMTFEDRFDTLDVSAHGPGSKWIAHTPWNGDFGAARFADPGPNGPFHVADGILSITMRRSADGKWTSGLLASADARGRGFLQSGGYFEMRARLPAGPGIWAGLWLAGAEPASRTRPEVDAIEYYGHEADAYYVTNHLWLNGRDTYHQTVRVPIEPGSASAAFHLYGVAIDAEHVTFYRDRRAVAELPARPELLQPMMLLVNLAAGGGWPIAGMAETSTMQVDYVRAYALRVPERGH